MEKQKAVLVRGNIICAGEASGYTSADIAALVDGTTISKYEIVAEFTGNLRCDGNMTALGVHILATGDIYPCGSQPDMIPV